MIRKGELTHISRGRSIGNEVGGWTHREFLEIGGVRLRHVAYTDYMDSFLQIGSGEYVLSTTKVGRYKFIAALKLPDGEVIRDISAVVRLFFTRLYLDLFVGAALALGLWISQGTRGSFIPMAIFFAGALLLFRAIRYGKALHIP